MPGLQAKRSFVPPSFPLEIIKNSKAQLNVKGHPTK